MVKSWNAHDYHLLRQWPFEEAEVRSLAFSPDSRSIAIAAPPTKVTMWDVTTGDLEQTFAGHKFLVMAVAFSPDGKILASGGMDHSLYLWHIPGK